MTDPSLLHVFEGTSHSVYRVAGSPLTTPPWSDKFKDLEERSETLEKNQYSFYVGPRRPVMNTIFYERETGNETVIGTQTLPQGILTRTESRSRDYGVSAVDIETTNVDLPGAED
jgi:hypothetical protein